MPSLCSVTAAGRSTRPFGWPDWIHSMLRLHEASRSKSVRRCPYCKSSLATEGQAQLSSCSLCSTVHHIECWRINGRCSVMGCLGHEIRRALGETIVETFNARVRRLKNALFLPLLIFAIAFLLARNSPPPLILAFFSLSLGVSLLLMNVLTFITYRCPACGHRPISNVDDSRVFFRQRDFIQLIFSDPEYCGNCNVALR